MFFVKQRSWFVKNIWNNPVWSKVIAALIIWGAPAGWSYILSTTQNITFKQSLLNTFTFKISLYWVLIAFLLPIVFNLIVYLIKRKKLQNETLVPLPIHSTISNQKLKIVVGRHDIEGLIDALKHQAFRHGRSNNFYNAFELFENYYPRLVTGINTLVVDADSELLVRSAVIYEKYGLVNRLYLTGPNRSDVLSIAATGVEFYTKLKQYYAASGQRK